MSMKEQNKIYQEVPADFYESEMRNANPLTKYYHKSRYEKIRNFIIPRYKKGMMIADLGCGSSSWNTTKLSVTGVDINLQMIEYGKSIGTIKDSIIADLDKPIPIENEKFDFVVMSEVLEHMENPEKQINEAKRILKKGGFLIITIPLDRFLSPWQIFFEIGCFLRGDLLGNEYFKKRCGHIQHFSAQSMIELLKKNQFKIAEKNITALNIGIIAQKQ